MRKESQLIAHGQTNACIAVVDAKEAWLENKRVHPALMQVLGYGVHQILDRICLITLGDEQHRPSGRR